MWSKAGYTDYDFMRMKQDAVERARDMNRRSSGSFADVHQETWHSPGTSDNGAHAQTETRCPRCGRVIRDGRHIYEARPAQGASQRPFSAGHPSPRSQPQPRPAAPAPAKPIYSAPPEQKQAPDASPASAGKINIPFLGELELDRDFLLVGGLLLVLLSEENDRLLLLALVYIMM
ncbi:MAG: hypothetical protein ACERKO_03775 [Acetanaerobacterium sp.]